MKRLNSILTYTAIFISFCAFFVSIYQTQALKTQTEIMQEQQHASVWPRLFISRNTGPNIHQIVLQNDGVGPAIIKSVEISLDGKTYKSWDDLFSAINGKKDNSISKSFVNNRVIKSGQQIIMCNLLDIELINKMNQLYPKITFDIYFTSVYGRCWRLKQETGKPFAVPEMVEDYPKNNEFEFMN